MTLAALARRIVRERSRPGSLGGLVAFLGAGLAIRALANAYLATLMGPHLSAAAGSPYLAGSIGIVAMWACTAGAARAYRTTAYLLDHRRFRGARLPRRAVVMAVVRCSLLRPTTAVLASLCVCAVVVSAVIWGPSGVSPMGVGVPLAAGALCTTLSYLALRAGRLGDRGAETVEILSLLLLTLGNPGLERVNDRLAYVARIGAVPGEPWGISALLALAPLILLAVSVGARMVRTLLRRFTNPADPPVVRNPFLRLYRADLPLGLFVGSYVIELMLVLASAIDRAALIRLSLALLGLRVLWYILFLARTSSRFAAMRPVPLTSPGAQVRCLLASAPYHAGVCVAPIVALAVRLLRT